MQDVPEVVHRVPVVQVALVVVSVVGEEELLLFVLRADVVIKPLKRGFTQVRSALLPLARTQELTEGLQDVGPRPLGLLQSLVLVVEVLVVQVLGRSVPELNPTI